MRRLSRYWLIPLVFHTLPATAQTATGTILGIVTDPSGAVVPGAGVVATNQSTGFTRSAASDAEGNYLLTFLPLGTYRVETKSAGFERMLHDGIQVEADERLRVDFTLAVGESSQTVEVSAGANRLCGGGLPGSQQSVSRFFDTSCFVAPPIYTYGNAGRNILIGPKMYNWDASLQRTFPIRESMRLEFRCEYFNVFNTPQFYPPMNLVGNPDFGTLTAIRSGSNRQGQLALKFFF